MSIGSSALLIAVGAILRYAVTASISGVSLSTIGLILMLAGVLGLVLSLLYAIASRPRRSVTERTVEEENPRYEPPAPRR
jgi:membrane protein implicated in regulation of membrane protease activity